jgi:excisionase family DNA binding protein
VNDDNCLTVKEVAVIFRLSTRTVYKKVKENTWPALQAKDGEAIRFLPEHVEQIMKLGEKQPPKPKGRIRSLYSQKAKP